jgi:hypothetical protein
LGKTGILYKNILEQDLAPKHDLMLKNFFEKCKIYNKTTNWKIKIKIKKKEVKINYRESNL